MSNRLLIMPMVDVPKVAKVKNKAQPSKMCLQHIPDLSFTPDEASSKVRKMVFHYTGRMPANWDKLRKRLDVDWRA